jgi:DNA helicase-2/ATP-dependent DNA helicase PcrA
VRELALSQGWSERPSPQLGEREQTRQADLGRLVRLADTLADGELDGTGFVAELERRFDPRSSGGGVNLLTYHRAKGLEFEAVFLPRLEEKELPCKRSLKRPAEIAEERRLLYVGMTRAKRWLWLSWTDKGKTSRFLEELEIVKKVGVKVERDDLPPAYEPLRAWRRKRSLADGVPAYVVFHNSALEAIAEQLPSTMSELGRVPGVGPAKLERYGEEVLAVLAAASS